MRFPTITICLILVVLLGSTAKAEIVLYCQSELETGFIKENGLWRTTKFVPERFTVKFNDGYTELHGLDETGFLPPYACSTSLSYHPDLVLCLAPRGYHETFTFNKAEMRFLFLNPSFGGYINPQGDTDSFFAGTCQKF